jgi:predicted dehydrogenase
MIQRKLKVGFIGGGYNSAVGRVHRSAIELDQRFELVAGCFSRSDQESKNSADQYAIDPLRVYSRVDDFLDNEADLIDVVAILTPQEQHFEHVAKCIQAGLPVICEKSLVSTCDQALSLKELLIRKNGFLTVTYNYTGYPMVRELKSLVSRGVIGDVQQVQIEMPQEGFSKLSVDGMVIPPQGWRLKDGPLPVLSLDLGVHIHMLIRFISGEIPEEVVAISSSKGNFEVIDNIQAIVKYSSGLECGIWYSKTALGYSNGLRVRVFGSKGTLEWVQEDPDRLNYFDNSGNRSVVTRVSSLCLVSSLSRYQRFKAGHPTGFLEAFANYYVDIANQIWLYKLGKTAPFSEYLFGIEESIEGLRLLEAISRSSDSRQWELV